MSRHARNVLHDFFGRFAGKRIESAFPVAARDPSIVKTIELRLSSILEKLPTSMMRAKSRQLTKRARQLEDGAGLPRGSRRIDAMIEKILDDESLEKWDKKRRQWRDARVKVIKAHACTIDVKPVVSDAITDVLSTLTRQSAKIRVPPSSKNSKVWRGRRCIARARGYPGRHHCKGNRLG
ncbi:MAG: hypothetical protein ACTSUE_23865 [Promethearchaeota archaeon]